MNVESVNWSVNSQKKAHLFFLIFLFLGISNLVSARQDEVKQKSEKPVFSITREELDANKDMNAGQLIMALTSNLPFPEKGAAFADVLKQIKLTENKVIKSLDDFILVQSYSKNSETGEEVATHKSRYYFEYGKFVRGPVLDDVGKITLTGKRVKVTDN